MSENWLERTEMLVGQEGLARLAASTVAVIGLGGVGAYAAEMIARAGVGRLILLDTDTVSVTNRNRQLLALATNIGRPKCEVMRERVLSIHPEAEVVTVQEYLTEENVEEVLERAAMQSGGKIDFLVDAIDTLAPKIALITYCVQHDLPLVSSMGAGAKMDATKVRLADLSKSHSCPLAYVLRKKLRKAGISGGFQVVFSEELPEREAIVPVEGERNKKSQVGTISYLPAVFGCVCAQAALTALLKES